MVLLQHKKKREVVFLHVFFRGCNSCEIKTEIMTHLSTVLWHGSIIQSLDHMCLSNTGTVQGVGHPCFESLQYKIKKKE